MRFDLQKGKETEPLSYLLANIQ